MPRQGAKGVVEELTALGADISDEDVHARVAALKASDPATLIYTSGTTGRPKGATAQPTALQPDCRVEGHPRLQPRHAAQDSWRSHSDVLAARARSRSRSQHRVVRCRCSAGAHERHPEPRSTFGEFKPDFILSVPRVFEKVYNSARAKAHGDGKGKIFDAAADTAVAWSEAQDKGGAGIVLKAKHALFDKLVYSKLRAALGGQCQLAISGGAPLGARLGHFFRGIGVTIYEGYGLTETTAAFAVNTIGAQKVGSVGKPLAGNSVRIAEDGEILLSGPVVFTGYCATRKATAESIENGWFHTGDLGTVDKDGYITITGRKKEIIVTAGRQERLPHSARGFPSRAPADQPGHRGRRTRSLSSAPSSPSTPKLFPPGTSATTRPQEPQRPTWFRDGELVGEIQDAIDEANKLVSHAEAIKKFRILPVDFSEDTGRTHAHDEAQAQRPCTRALPPTSKRSTPSRFSASSFSQQRTARTEFGAGVCVRVPVAQPRRLRSFEASVSHFQSSATHARPAAPIAAARITIGQHLDHGFGDVANRGAVDHEPGLVLLHRFPERHHCARR